MDDKKTLTEENEIHSASINENDNRGASNDQNKVKRIKKSSNKASPLQTTKLQSPKKTIEPINCEDYNRVNPQSNQKIDHSLLTNSLDQPTKVEKKIHNTNKKTAELNDVFSMQGKKNTALIRNDSSLSLANDPGKRSYSEDFSLDRSLDDGDLRLQVTHCRCMPKRYVLAILSFFGFFNVYCLRVDLSVALVAMTNNHTRVRTDGSEYWVPAEFDWSSQLQGHILSAFYYGYLITQIPSGYLAARFGGKTLFGMAILFSAILTLLTPLASRKHWSLLFALRFLEGLCEGCIYPAMYAIWSRWAPPLERAKLVTIPHSGSYSGSVAGTLVAGYLCELCGWAWVFYLFGLFALIWVVVWQIMVSDSPEEDRHISMRERAMIIDSLENEQTRHYVTEPLPWCSILTSMPFLAILVAHSCEGWGFSVMQTSLPKYLSEAMNFRISRTGEYTATLYLVMGITVFLAGQISDFLRQNEWLSARMARKIFTITGFSFNAIAFLVSIRMEKAEHAVIVMIIGAGIESLAWVGFGINHLDIAPRYASILFGITNTCATIPGIVSPLMVGAITATGERAAWESIFIISSCMFIGGAVFYAFFASAELQPWAGDPLDNSLDEEKVPLKKRSKKNKDNKCQK